jgi:hypothetical protein
MKAFENVEIAFVERPTARQVLDAVRRDEPCHADPLSRACNCEAAKKDYWATKRPGVVHCQQCPTFSQTLQEMMAAWEDWVLGRQDTYT